MRCASICIDSDNKPVIGSTQIHNPWRAAREKVCRIKECSYHTESGKQYRPFKSDWNKVGHCKCRLTADVHRPVLYQHIISHAENGSTAQAAENKCCIS